MTLLEQLVSPLSLEDGPVNYFPFGGERGLHDYPPSTPTQKKAWHPALDSRGNANWIGRNIYAATDGVVVAAVPGGNMGYHIVIEHDIGGQRFYSVYGHLQPWDKEREAREEVTVGMTVNAGQLIGHMGRTGTGETHLHFEVRTAANVNLSAGDPIGWPQYYWAFDRTQFSRGFVDLGPLPWANGYSDDWKDLPLSL